MAPTEAIELDPEIAPVTVETIAAIASHGARVRLAPATVMRIDRAHQALLRAAAAGTPIYGLNTGLGAAVDTEIAADAALQERIVLARAVGVGRLADRAEVRAMIAARLVGLCTARSGASPAVVAALADLLNHGIHPSVPMTGSVGEGDLAPLAHVALALVGRGEVELGGALMPAEAAFARCGLAPPVLRGKDGLALVSSNAASVGTAALLVIETGRVLRAMLAAAALSFEGFRGNLSPLDPRATALRPAPGQGDVAGWLGALFAGGALARSGTARRLQDPLSFRCVASILGAAFTALAAARTAVDLELATSDDNPAILVEDDTVLANANFDSTHLALALEALGLALARAAAASAERVLTLMSPAMTGLPRFLTDGLPGRNGFATVQKTVAALLAGIGHRANPMPVVVAPVADRVENYATMAPAIGDKTRALAADVRLLAAIELMVAAQAVDLREAVPLGDGTQALQEAVRALVPRLVEDRPASPDIIALDRWIASGALDPILSATIGTVPGTPDLAPATAPAAPRVD